MQLIIFFLYNAYTGKHKQRNKFISVSLSDRYTSIYLSSRYACLIYKSLFLCVWKYKEQSWGQHLSFLRHSLHSSVCLPLPPSPAVALPLLPCAERKYGNTKIRKFGNTEIRKMKFGNTEIRKVGKSEIRKYGNSEIRKYENTEIRKYGKNGKKWSRQTQVAPEGFGVICLQVRLGNCYVVPHKLAICCKSVNGATVCNKSLTAGMCYTGNIHFLFSFFIIF